VRRALVVTSIFAPTDALRRMVRALDGWSVVVVGDRKTPEDWQLDGVRFLSLAEQLESGGALARELPVGHYARKNLGYLQAIRDGAGLIAESDDDNRPYDNFFAMLDRRVHAPSVPGSGWHNVYSHFTDDQIWPRGFPLELITADGAARTGLGPAADHECPVQQYLADGDPDVDAVYRLTSTRQTRFRPGSVVFPPGAYSPFNSQNTAWWPQAYPLLYLPSHVSFRMTDVWRSFVAQACLHAAGFGVAFHGPTVWHERHAHDLLADLEQEVPGYLHSARAVDRLSRLPLSSTPGATGENLRSCYEALVDDGLVPSEELPLVDLWLTELDAWASS
jgi:STELLO glycosyltransferases